MADPDHVPCVYRVRDRLIALGFLEEIVMKLILLAATAMIAAPLAAQTTTPMPGQSTMPAGQTTDPSTSMQTDSSTQDGTMQNGTMQNGTMQNGTMQNGTMQNGMSGTMSPGGYQPSGSPLSGPVTPGVTPTFQQAPSPDQAYPAPPPMASYPMCKPGQTDHCMQSGAGASSSHATRPRRR
jgi:hypothetical protein